VLLDNGFPILPYIDYLSTIYNYIIYTQPLCTSLTELDINLIIVREILSFVKSMLDTEIKISDIFYKNFGLIGNKLYFYDYHNVEKFGSGNGFLVKNLYCLFTRLGININPRNEWTNCLDIKDILSRELAVENYGHGRFPRPFHKLLIKLTENNLDRSKHYLQSCLSYIDNEINQTTIFSPMGGCVRENLLSVRFIKYMSFIIDKNCVNKIIIGSGSGSECMYLTESIFQLAYLYPSITFIFHTLNFKNENENENVRNLITRNVKHIPNYHHAINNDNSIYIKFILTLAPTSVINHKHGKTVYILKEFQNLLNSSRIFLKECKMIVKIENENYLLYI